MPLLDPNRLFPAESATRAIARDLFDSAAQLPIISPHGHTDPHWFAGNTRFSDATSLFLTPDHYVLRMLRSRGVSYDDLGVPRRDGGKVADGRTAWAQFARHYHLFTGTPSQLWIDHAMHWGFDIDERLSAKNADAIYHHITQRLGDDDMRPLAILDKANVEVIATTEFALDSLEPQETLEQQGLVGRVRTTYRPDDVTDPDHPAFRSNLALLGELTDCDTARWDDMIEAHRRRRALFRRFGATATDHGVPDARTEDLPKEAKQALLTRLLAGAVEKNDSALFRAQMLTEMASLSVEDGMVMQIHAGVARDTDPLLLAERGSNLGADIPCAVSPVDGLGPLLRRFGNTSGFRLIFFCLDESILSREIAPMAGYWPALSIGPPWWYHDSPRGIGRYLDSVVESAGFYNLAGFNDDTRALLSIPARHDVWRRCVAAFLADMVARRCLEIARAEEIMRWLVYDAARQAYNVAD